MLGRFFKDYIASFFLPASREANDLDLLQPEVEVLKLPGPFSFAVALGEFSHDVKNQSDLAKLVLMAKRCNSVKAADRLSEFLIGYLEEGPLPHTPDILVTIPDSIGKHSFSPVQHMAQSLAVRFGWELRHDIFVHARITKPQKSRGFEERLNDERPRYRLAESSFAENRHILIFDDIFATGKTLIEAGNLLAQCSPASVMALVIAQLSHPPG
jgi:predicted amidophosphoribosyltransferase